MQTTIADIRASMQEPDPADSSSEHASPNDNGPRIYARADLRGVNLRHLNLHGIDMVEADLRLYHYTGGTWETAIESVFAAPVSCRAIRKSEAVRTPRARPFGMSSTVGLPAPSASAT